MNKKTKRTYYIEEHVLPGGKIRHYVYYISGVLPSKEVITTLFDVCDSEEQAKRAIELHKRGEHGTQWTPDKQ